MQPRPPYYTVSPNQNLTLIASFFNLSSPDSILPYNNNINKDVILPGQRINVPILTCACIEDSFLGHTFSYTTVGGDTYEKIAGVQYSNLTTAAVLAADNAIPPNRIPTGAEVKVTVNCSCGDAAVSTEYGLFETYPIAAGENLSSIAKKFGVKDYLIRSYNPGSNFSSGIVFVPAKDQNGSYLPLQSNGKSKGLSGGGIAGIVVAVIIVLLGLASYLYFGVYKRQKAKKSQFIPSSFGDKSTSHSNAAMDSGSKSQDGSAALLGGFTVDRSVEFSYEELARATNDFSMANKIGEGGFGAVYYAELRGEKAAIKKMDMEATREFLAELKVLTHVHHLNLVRLIGYCTDGSLFLVYEFIENGNLSQHLRGSERDPLEWSTRVQIALDSARGLEYIHEHTVPVYIHRDIKSANILIDKKFHAKVADFGLTKLTQAGGMTQPTRLVGTFGYMPPEYAQFGDVSPKIDVFAFGVVLYELISAKEAIVKTGVGTESMGLVGLFEDALNQPEPKEHLKKLVDPRLGDNYPIDSAHKTALLAKACTQENPQLRQA
ncbi:uncharacterized protein A4U43_C09F15790 [Asparagus officinalis]|uniref:non-specific serine/threonine protein kinase n=1 Tax=Asparagus officinalis TaxID=4686 RepID=A0A5P1E7P0_ASPOF|nr:uncharacterized protein A4U43_C09F15790 [Asparagus officinalis]